MHENKALRGILGRNKEVGGCRSRVQNARSVEWKTSCMLL